MLLLLTARLSPFSLLRLTVLDACGNPIIPTLVTTPSATPTVKVLWLGYSTTGIVMVTHMTGLILITSTCLTLLPAADWLLLLLTCPALAVQPATPTVIDACGNPIIPTLVTTPSLPTVKVLWLGYSTTGIVMATHMTGLIPIPSTCLTSLRLPSASTVDCPALAVQPATPTVLTLVATRLSLPWLLRLRLPL